MRNFVKATIDVEGREFLVDRELSIPMAESMGVSSSNGEIHFPYFFNGQIVRTKSRNMKDKKKMHFDSLSEDQKDNFKMPFWNQHNWLTNDFLIITEGEFDAIAIAQLGEFKVVSLPNGSGSVNTTFRNQYEYLQQFDEIYIAFDMDEAGERAVEEAKKLIDPKKFRRINFPAKDANEWLQENPYLEKKDLEDLMRNASKIIMDEIIYFRDLPPSFFYFRDYGVSTGWQDLDDLLGGIRTKEVTVISADTGAGKTTFAINLLCNLIKKDPAGFWINSWEMDYEVVVRKVAGNILGSLFKVAAFTETQRKEFEKWMQNNNAMINPKRSKADILTLRKQIEIASKIYGVKYILLDHLDYISSTFKDKESHEKIKEAIEGIHNIAMEFNVHILLIAHPKQIEDGSGKIHMGHLKGSAAIKQYADNIILLQNMAQENLAIKDNRMKVMVPKNRFFGTKGEITLRYVLETDSYIDNNQLFKTCEHLREID